MKSNKTLTLLVILNIASLALYFIFRKPSLPYITSESLIALKTFTISSKNNIPLSDLNIPPYPFVQTKPDQLKYFITAQRDQRTDQLLHKGGMHFAAKRVHELMQWGSDIPILKSFSTEATLADWWSKTQPRWWEIYKFKKYNSWEAELAQYDRFIRYEFSDIIDHTNGGERDRRLGILLTNIDDHNKQLLSTIRNLNKSDQDKAYLNLLRVSIASELNRTINNYVDTGKTDVAEFPLTSLKASEDYGRYDIYLVSNNVPGYILDSLYIHTATADVRPSKIKVYGTDQLVFTDVPITNNDAFLELHYAKSNIFSDFDWYLSTEKSNFTYSLLTPQISSDQAMLEQYFQVQYPIRQKAYLQLVEVSKVETVTDEILLPLNKSASYTKHLRINANQPYLARLISKDQISSDDLSKIKIDLAPLYRPTLILKKKKTLRNKTPNIKIDRIDDKTVRLETHNVSDVTKNNIGNLIGYGWKTSRFGDVIIARYTLGQKLLFLFIFTVFITGTALFTPKRYFDHTKQFVIIRLHRLQEILNAQRYRLSYYLSTMRAQIGYKKYLVIILLGIVHVADVFLLKKYNELVFVVLLVTWILYVSLFRLRSRQVLIIAYAFLILTIIARILADGPSANKMAIWVFTLMTISVFLMVYEFFHVQIERTKGIRYKRGIMTGK